MKYFFSYLTVTLLFITSVTAQIPTNGLVAWYPFSGNANDGSGNNLNGTVHGATLSTDRFGNTNSAYNFNGTSDYINVADNNLLDFTNAYSVSGWFYASTVSGTQRTILSKARNSTQTGLSVNLDALASYKLICDNTDGNGPHLINSDTIPTANAWYHTVVTYDGATLKIYVNGTLAKSMTYTISLVNSTHDLDIGSQQISLNDFFSGKIDDIGLWNRALTSTEVTQIFSSTNCTTPNITTGLVASYPFTNNANDASGNNNNGTVTGATLTTDRFGNTNSAYNFNGTSNFIQVANSASLTFSTAVSFSFWLNSPDYTMGTTGPLNERVPIGKVSGAGDGIAFETVDNIGTCCGAQFYLRNGVTPVSYEDPTAMPINSWVHIAGSYDGTTLNLYQNNVLLGSATGSLNLTTVTQDLFIGKEGSNGRFFKGKIDDVRIYNRALTPCDVDSLFHMPNLCTGVTASITPQGNTTFCAGGSVALNASAGSSYSWSNSATSQNITATQTNTYTVTVTNANGCTASASQSVIVNPKPTAAPTAAPATICLGQSTTLAANATAGSGTISTYSWSSGLAGNVSGGSVSPSGNTTYVVTVTNSNNCSVSASTSVTVNTPDITTGLVASYPFTNNANDVSGNNLNGTVNGATLTTDRFGNPNSAYSFNGTNQKITVNDNALLSFSNAKYTLSYWVNINSNITSDGGGIISKYGITNDFEYANLVYLNGDLASGHSNLAGSCGLFTTHYTATGIFNNWHHVVAIGDSVNGERFYVDGNLVATNPFNVSCFSGNTNGAGNLYFGMGGGWNQQYYFHGLIDDISIYDRALTPCDVDSLFHMPNLCTGVTASITPQGNTTFCAGGSVALNASAGSSYSWSNSATTQNITATQTNTYTVTVTNANGCTASASQIVTVNSNPATPTISASSSTTFCQGGSVTLTSSSATGYLWSNSATSQGITVNQTNTYTVTVSNANNCTASASQSVTVNPNPATPTISASGPTTFCQGGSVTLTSSSANGYSWSNSSTSQSITVNQTNTYTVTVSNANNCTASASQNVTVNPLPNVTINPLPAFVNINASALTLSGSPSGGTYSGAGVSGNSFNPTVAGLGNKQVTYSYTNGNNCSNSASTNTIVYDTTGVVCTTYDTVTTHITVNDTTFITFNDTTHVTVSTTDTLLIDVTLTGIAPPNNTNSVSVFPNPAHDHLVIDNGNFSSMSGYSVKITNTLGQIVFNQPITSQQFSIDLNTWGGTGTYILYVLDASQAIKATKEIILQ